MKTLFTFLITLTLLTMASPTQAEERTPQPGELQRIQGTLQLVTAGEFNYFTITMENPLRAQSANGSPLVARTLQVAGLNESEWAHAKSLVGQTVIADGRLMEAETRYHKTPLLIVTRSLKTP